MFLDLIVKQGFVSDKPKIVLFNTTFDGGKTYSNQYQQMLVGSFIFVSDEKVSHHRKAQNILDILAKFGGLATLITKMFRPIATFVNNK